MGQEGHPGNTSDNSKKRGRCLHRITELKQGIQARDHHGTDGEVDGGQDDGNRGSRTVHTGLASSTDTHTDGT